MTEERLVGGNLTSVVRVGGTIRRPAGTWTSAVHALLRHVRARGIDWVPEPLGVDASGREMLSFVEGEVVHDDAPAWLWDDDLLVAAARMLRQFHDATLDFDSSGLIWQIPIHEPVEVVCHNDFAPYNFVFRDRRLAGVIDWDTASPGSRNWDLSYLAYRLVPLQAPTNPESPVMGERTRIRRLGLLCETYGSEMADVARLVPSRLADLRQFTLARAASDGATSPLWRHAALYETDAAYATRLIDGLASA